MTDRTQFEAMLEALINEDQEAAKDIFHNIVVAKSREIYEELLAEEFGEGEEEESEEEESEEEDPFGGNDEGESDNPFGGDDEGEDEGEDEEGDEPFSDEESSDGDYEEEIRDLKSDLADLRAEFEQLLAGEEDEPEHSDMFGGEDEFGDDDMGGEFGAEKPVDEFSQMFEYVNKVALPKHGNDGDNTTSIFNKSKYNDMGGTVKNIAQGGVAKGEGTEGGLLKPSTQDLKSGNINVPGGKAGKTGFKSQVPGGHGAEKKGKGESGVDKHSIIGGR